MSVSIYIFKIEDRLRPKVHYTFDTMLSILGLPYRFFLESNTINQIDTTVLIFYGLDNIPLDLMDYVQRGGYIIQIAVGPWEEPLETKRGWLLNLLAKRDPQLIYELIETVRIAQGTIVKIRFDIIYFIFFLLSLEEELLINSKDLHGRFPFSASLQCEAESIQWPMANIYLSLLLDLIVKGYKWRDVPLLQKWYWPGGEPFGLLLTHDVDTPMKWHLKQGIKYGVECFMRGDWTALRKFFGEIYYNPNWNFMKIIDLEKKYGFKSTFYFCVKGNNDPGIRYHITNKRIRHIINKISQMGWEIGLHGSFDANNKERLVFEKTKLEIIFQKSIKGNRYHYLRFDVRSTWKILDESGFQYDTSLGYPDHEGFRSGICLPYYPFNYEIGKPLSLLEIPLVVMDGTLFEHRHLNPKKAWEQVIKLLGLAKKYNGLMTLLWHVRSFNETDYPGWSDVYIKTLEWVKEEGGYVDSASEVANWWNERSSMYFIGSESGKNKIEWSFEAGKSIRAIYFKLIVPNKEQTWLIDVIGAEFKCFKNQYTYSLTLREIPANSKVTIIAYRKS